MTLWDGFYLSTINVQTGNLIYPTIIVVDPPQKSLYPATTTSARLWTWLGKVNFQSFYSGGRDSVIHIYWGIYKLKRVHDCGRLPRSLIPAYNLWFVISFLNSGVIALVNNRWTAVLDRWNLFPIELCVGLQTCAATVFRSHISLQ